MSGPPTPPGLEQLTLDEKIGQLFVPGAEGTFMNSTSWQWLQLERQVREQHVGGFIWFSSNVYETAELNRRLQTLSKVPLLISADLEAGVGMRFAGTTFWPPAMAVGATGDPSLAERQGRIVAIEARAIGVNHLLAPVTDVNVDPDNPVINARSFGEDPDAVARFVAAFIKGARSEGVLTTAKHFPGHGDTRTDSHRSLPVLAVDRARLERIELVPIRAAIAAGVDAVMPGHLSVPALDPTPAPVRIEAHDDNPYVEGVREVTEGGTMPATVSKPMLEGVLRGELGFGGLIVSDAFDMGGLTEHFDAGEADVRAIEAGEDQILMSPDLDAAIEAVKAAVTSGRIALRRIDESVQRILEAKGRVTRPVATPDEIFTIVDSEEVRETAQEIATRAITLVRAEAGALPLSRGARVVELVVSEFAESATPLPDFDYELRQRLAAPPAAFLLDSKATSADIAPILEAARNADVVVIALAIRARSGAGRIAVPDVARLAIEQLAGLPARLIGVSFGTPYLLREVPSLQTYLCAYGIQPVLQDAAIHALFGEAPITGRLPVTIPGLAVRGQGIARKRTE
ncbi:MAG: glycoside hydrolase family 3 N-terminal domain-containing protein [Acidobacteriota bacterium]